MSDYRSNRRSDAEILSARLAGGRVAPKSPTEALQPESVPPPPARSRAVRHPLVVFLNFVLTLVVIAIVGAGAAIFVGKMQFDRPGVSDQERTVTVENGSTVSGIADVLQKNGVITNKLLFVIAAWLSRQDSAFKAGDYLIPAHASMREIMEAMVSGKGSKPYQITIAEGLTSTQVIACMMADTMLVDGNTAGLNQSQVGKCRAAAANLIGDISEIPPEGSILPDTYNFSRGDTRENVLNRMRRERDKAITDIWSRRASDLPIKTIDDLAVLASIVEKETSLADERSRVASVFINRLKLNMKLQSDPTVIFGLFGSKGKPPGFALKRSDLSSQNPFNTYMIAGLPPSPIANPGRASLEAVANPSRTRDLFFVADGTGGHVFAETYEDHLKNVARWREIREERTKAAASGDTAGESATPGDDATPSVGDSVPSDDVPMALQPVDPAPAP
ncbi:MAG: endolytic transglycosylase MltG [Bauldia sp.]